MKLTLPTDSAERKRYPVAGGPLSYFPAAIAGVALVCQLGDEKHNKNSGLPMHHARGKSGDHADCIVRHLMDVNDITAHLKRSRAEGLDAEHESPETVKALLHEANQLTWRALALSQELHETYGDAPLAPGARLPEPPADTNRLCRAYNLASDDRCLQNALHTGDHCGTYSNWPVAPDAAQQPGLPVIVELMAKGAAQVPAGPCVWETDRGTWYFNRDDGLAENGASREEYLSEAAARAAYWADRDAQLVPVDG